MPPRQPRRSRSLLLPIALTAAATAATIGLWYWLESSDDHSHHHHHHPVDSPSESESESHHPPRGSRHQKPDQSRRLRLHTVDEESEPSSTLSHAPKPSPSSRYSTLSRKYVLPPKTRSIALVLNSESPQSTLLNSLPRPLPIPPNTTLHILIYTPALHSGVPSTKFSSAPASPSKLHEMAYSILPTEYPKEYILPYTVHPTGTSALLGHIIPEIVYIEEGLVGNNGELMKELLERSRIGEGIVVLGTGIPSKQELALLQDSDDDSLDMEKIKHEEAIVPGGPDSKGKEKSTSQVTIGGGQPKKWWQEPGWDGVRGGGSVLERQFLEEDWVRRVVERG